MVMNLFWLMVGGGGFFGVGDGWLHSFVLPFKFDSKFEDKKLSSYHGERYFN